MSSSLLQPSLVSQKVEILSAEDYLNDQTCLTVILHEEDHTIGNSVKHIMCQMEGVEFCGYNIPHPLEDKILLRVQTKEGYNAATILLEALDHLAASFRKISEKFESSYAKFQPK